MNQTPDIAFADKCPHESGKHPTVADCSNLKGSWAMDVLGYYRPTVNWDGFVQGPLSDDVWLQFREVIMLCHAQQRWEKVEQEARHKPMARSLYPESDYMRRKRKGERQLDIDSKHSHKVRAAFLAGSKLWEIAGLVQGRQDMPDREFSLALVKAVGPQFVESQFHGHERAEWAVLAFDSFDARSEVSGNCDAMAARWRCARGHRQ